MKEPVTKDIDLYAKASKIDSLIDQIGMMKERMGKMLAFVDKLITRFNDDVKIINDLKSGAVLTVLAVQAGRPNVDENPNEKMTTYIFKKVTDWEDNQDKIIAMPVGNKDQINARNRKIDELVTLNEKSNTKLSVIKDALQKFMETYDKQIK